MRGWNEGVVGMRAGGSRLLRVPPELGYGAKAVDDVIPPHSQLIFIIELLELN
jgi:FKBP-type peptidyl-prolyl cis-trans isomerase FkpA